MHAPLLRLLGAAASHGLLTGQIVFSAAFVGACEIPNWIHAPRQVKACLERWEILRCLTPFIARDVLHLLRDRAPLRTGAG